ncbi:hypothetical protein QQ045_000027 [Rhodiola kirilowii]
MRPAFAFHTAAMDMFHNHLSQPPKLGPISIRVKIIRTEGVKALFSGVSATVLRQMLYSTICMDCMICLSKKAGKDVFSLFLKPGFDAAFVMGLVLVLDQINGDDEDGNSDNNNSVSVHPTIGD